MTILVETLDGTWETLGKDRFPGAFPADVNPTYDSAGPKEMTFSIRRPRDVVHRDLLPFTPVELHAPGSADPLWAGFTLKAPPGASGQSTTVTCHGWQSYLDEQQMPLHFVHARQSEWTDAGGLLEAIPSFTAAGATVSTGDMIQLTFPQGQQVRGGSGPAATLDLGDGNMATQAIIEWESSANAGSATNLYVIGHHTPYWGSASVTGKSRHDSIGPIAIDSTKGGPQVTLGSAVSLGYGYRYWTMLLWLSALSTPSADIWVRIRRLLLGRGAFLKQTPQPPQTDITWSTLTGDKVLTNLISYGLPQLSPDTRRITPVTFTIPHFHFGEPAPAREISSRVNDYHGYNLGVDAQRRLFFEPQPSTPTLQIDAERAEFTDESANDGSELYNHVIVTGRSGAGRALQSQFHSADFLGLYRPATTIGHPDTGLPWRVSPNTVLNPGFETNANSWASISAGHTITRTTSFADTGTASGAWVSSTTAAGGIRGDLSGTFDSGKTYRLTFRFRNHSVPHNVRFRFGMVAGTDFVETIVAPTASDSAWTSYTMLWSPATNVSGAQIELFRTSVSANQSAYHIDTFELSEIDGYFTGVAWRDPSLNNASKDTVLFNSAPDSWSFNSFGSDVAIGVTEDFTGTFKAGVPYRLGLAIGFEVTSGSALAGWTMRWTIEFGTVPLLTVWPGGNFTRYVEEYTQPPIAAGSVISVMLNNTNVAKRLTWVPQEDTTDGVAVRVTFELIDPTNSHTWSKALVDTMTLEEGVPASLMDQRNRRRSFKLEVNAPTDQQTMRTLAQAWLLAHRTTPFKGSLSAIKDGVVSTLPAGIPLAAKDLGRHHNQMIRINNAPNPDSGLDYRDAIITGVTGYDTAALALDNTPQGLQALINRMNVTSGQQS